MPNENYCPRTEDHRHVVDFHSVTQVDVDPEEMIMDVWCRACGISGAFRIPDPKDIDW